MIIINILIIILVLEVTAKEEGKTIQVGNKVKKSSDGARPQVQDAVSHQLKNAGATRPQVQDAVSHQ